MLLKRHLAGGRTDNNTYSMHPRFQTHLSIDAGLARMSNDLFCPPSTQFESIENADHSDLAGDTS